MRGGVTQLIQSHSDMMKLRGLPKHSQQHQAGSLVAFARILHCLSSSDQMLCMRPDVACSIAPGRQLRAERRQRRRPARQKAAESPCDCARCRCRCKRGPAAPPLPPPTLGPPRHTPGSPPGPRVVYRLTRCASTPIHCHNCRSFSWHSRVQQCRQHCRHRLPPYSLQEPPFPHWT